MINDTVLNFLKTRKSVPLTQIGEPGPNQAQVDMLLEIAARVPDHGRMEPWRFIIYRGPRVHEIGDALVQRAVELRGELSEADLDRERNRLNRAPLAIGVVSNITNVENIPQWEQFLSAGAVCMNLLSAVTAAGFAANWVSGWYSDDAKGRAILGLARHETMAGIVHIGSCGVSIPDRPRPDMTVLVTEYSGPYQD